MKSLRVIAGSIVTIVLLVSSGHAQRVGLSETWVDSTRPFAYRIEGGSEKFHATGKICDLTRSFVLEGGGVRVKFTPKSNLRGRYAYSGKIDGVVVDGRGTYEVQYDGLIAIGIVAASLDAPKESEVYRLEQVRGDCEG
jgi:hypothetical protein